MASPSAAEPALPWAVKASDALSIVALLLTPTIVATGGFREWTPFGRLSITDWSRPLIFAALLLLVRHLRYPRPNIAVRLWRGFHAVRRAPATRAVLPTFLWTRTAVLVIGFLAMSVFGFPEGVPLPWRVYSNELANLPARWDTGWYVDVAADGYKWWRTQPNYQQNIAFFPVYPLLMRYGSLLFARELVWTGVAISWAAFLGALIYLFQFARVRLGDERAAMAVALISSYPFALFFSTAYTESLFLLTIVGACYHFERDELWQAGLWGLTAGLTRPNGCLLSVVLGLLAIQPLWAQGWRPALPPVIGWKRMTTRLATAACPGIGMLIFSTYIYFLTGNPFQWITQNAAWGRVYRSVDSLVEAHWHVIGEHGLYQYAATRTLDLLQVPMVVLALAAVWPVFRRFGLPYATLIAINVLPPLMMGGLLSMGRVTSVIFPTFLWLAAVIPAHHRFGWIAVFAMLQALCAALFFTWRPLY